MDQIEKHFYLINKINTNYYIYLQNNEANYLVPPLCFHSFH